jgi:hypothetical protein
MTGGWSAVFVTASVLNAVAAVTALLVLKPLRAGLRTAPAEPSFPASALASGEAGEHRNAS